MSHEEGKTQPQSEHNIMQDEIFTAGSVDLARENNTHRISLIKTIALVSIIGAVVIVTSIIILFYMDPNQKFGFAEKFFTLIATGIGYLIGRDSGKSD